MISTPTSSSPAPRPWLALLRRHETILLLVLVAEWLFFYWAGTSVNRRGVTVGFGTIDRQFDILRHTCEIGLLALALTPVILTAGIDLSVGSLLGLCAIVFGGLWRDVGLSIPLAIALTLTCGAAAGGLNAILITALRLPPLIVTLGTFSLFRGLAEAITRGAVTYTDFPAGFLALGQERAFGLPTQAWVFAVAAIAVWLLVHRTTLGRSFRAIGFSPEGARYAGLPVNRRLALVYVLAGLISAIAAVIYTARLGQAKADAGLGYELFAITAVVLGGTSIFGGSGSVHGTLLGVAAIAVLKNGLASLPIVIRLNAAEELSGVLTGALLLVALTASVIPRIVSRLRPRPASLSPASVP
jgi:ribose/xylose/arabinose/galactoside ABC-type transport system permease subunit